MFILSYSVFLLFLFLFFLVLLFNLNLQIVLIVLNGRLVRFVGFMLLQIPLSCLLVYECLALGLILSSVGLLLVVSDWDAVAENSVGDSNIRFERHIFFLKVR